MLEETPNIRYGNRGKCRAYRFYQCLFGPGCGLAKEVLDLGEGLLDRVVVRRVRRQVDELAASLLDELPYPPGSMCSEVIHDHLSSFEAGREHLLYVGLEYPSGGRSFYGKRWSHTQEGHAR